MPEKTEICEIYVKRLERWTLDEKYFKIVFDSPYGEWIVRAKKKYFRIFCPGEKYEGIFKISGMSDFLGEKNEWENVCTINNRLEKILGENILFRIGEKKIICNDLGDREILIENKPFT